jgi:hypothetical protein
MSGEVPIEIEKRPGTLTGQGPPLAWGNVKVGGWNFKATKRTSS